MGIPATQIRRGMAIIFQGEPCRVIEFHHHTPGNLRAMVHAKLRKLRSGTTTEHRFRASDTIEPASMETHELEFSYRAGKTAHFMNSESFEMIELEDDVLGDASPWVSEGMKIRVEFFEDAPVGIELPNSMTLEIAETAPPMKGATASASNKPAVLSNGVTVSVPDYLSTGDRVRVNPNTGEYLDRAKQ